MDLRPAIGWHAGGKAVDGRILQLLRAIAHSGSLRQAVAAVGLSYRHAWGMIGALEAEMGERLVMLERGRGATLTVLGARLVAADERLRRRLEPQLSRHAVAAGRESGDGPCAAANRLVLHASHDVALAILRDRMVATGALALDLHFHGSLDSLAALARGQCDVAGFHVPEAAGPGALLDRYRPWLTTKTLRLVQFATREQGLMVAKGNPLGIATLADLARTGARFVNRQAGSGTRLLFDHLLAAHRVRPARIDGYQVEEFTHAAVAATVASGMADAGFGIEAAARKHDLDFVPVASERYFLAARAAAWKRSGPAALLGALRGKALQDLLRELPGYAPPPSLDLVTVDDALGDAA